MASRRSSTSSKSGVSYEPPYAGPEMYSPRSDDLDDIQQPTDTPNFPEPNISQSPQPHRLSTLSILSQEATRRSRPQARHSTGTPTVEDLFKLFANTKSESREMRRSLRNAQIKLEQSRARAAKAERLALDMAQRVRDASDERASALREGATVREELGQYKARYESALKEISRARELLKDTDNLRYDAEVQAARARDIARKMRTDILVSRAKEEGRRMGYEEGAFAGQNVGYRVGRRNDPDPRGVTDAMADLLEDEDAFRGYIGRYSPPPVQQMNIPRTPEQAPEPTTPLQRAEPVFSTTPPQQFPVSQPSTVGRYINDDPFVTPTPAPRPPSTSASTTTLPAAPPTNLAFQPMPTISERSSVPDVVNTEPPVSRHSSVRRDRVVSPPATTPRSPVLPLPSNPNMHVNVYVPMPPPGQVYEESPGVPPIGGEDYLPPPPTGQMPGYPGGEPGYYPSVPGSSQVHTRPPSSRDRVYGSEYSESVVGSRPGTREGRQHAVDMVDMLRESSPRPTSQQFSSPRSGPPRRRPPTTVPAPLAGPPQSASYDDRSHRRSQSLNSPGASRYDGSPRQGASHLQAAPPTMRRSSSGAPQISVQSPSDPDLSIHTPSHEGAMMNDYLSPTTMPSQLPPSQPASQQNSRTAPQHYQSRHQPTIYTEPPSPPSPRNVQRFPPTIYENQSPQDPNPPRRFPPAPYQNGPYRRPTSVEENLVPSPVSENNVPLPVRQGGPLPTRQRSQHGSRQPSPQGTPTPLPPSQPVPDRVYGGQQPIPVPPRTGSRTSNAGYATAPMAPSSSSHGHGSIRGSPRTSSPAPLPVPSPSRNGHRRPVNSNAGATPRVTSNGLPANALASPSWNSPRLPVGSPRAGSPSLPPGSLYTHFDRGSMASLADVAELATATASHERLAGAGGWRK